MVVRVGQQSFAKLALQRRRKLLVIHVLGLGHAKFHHGHPGGARQRRVDAQLSQEAAQGTGHPANKSNFAYLFPGRLGDAAGYDRLAKDFLPLCLDFVLLHPGAD